MKRTFKKTSLIGECHLQVTDLRQFFIDCLFGDPHLIASFKGFL